MISSENPYRVFGVYRFILALLVVISHTWDFTYEKPQDHVLVAIGVGNASIMTFFVLSGFIINEAVDIFYSGKPFKFLANRFLRLIPPYWAALSISIVLHLALKTFSEHPLPPNYFPDGMFSVETILVNVTALFPFVNFQKLFGPANYYYFVSYAWAVLVEFAFYLSVFAACLLYELRPAKWGFL